MKCKCCGQEIIKDSKERDQAKEILSFLNELTGKNYRPVEANLKLVMARIKQHSHEDVAKVVAFMCKEWRGTKMEKYLRPATLFNDTKFNQYIGEI